jgi:hypothetical protein
MPDSSRASATPLRQSIASRARARPFDRAVIRDLGATPRLEHGCASQLDRLLTSSQSDEAELGRAVRERRPGEEGKPDQKATSETIA